MAILTVITLYVVGIVNAWVYLFWEYGYVTRTVRERLSMFGMACVWPVVIGARLWRRRNG